MTSYPRYAIYFAPQPGTELDRFGSNLLGYDAFSGKERPFPNDIEKALPDWRNLTEDPRRYGFHATLKAPFYLAPGKAPEEILAACETFAEKPRAIPVIKPVVSLIDGFAAIVPADASAALEGLAADCVSAFDCFRAPLTPQDRARRNPSKLAPSQRENLDRWGYPYVMQDFRFHMTLTCRLRPEHQRAVLTILQGRFSEIKISALAIDNISLFQQDDAASRFRIAKQYLLHH